MARRARGFRAQTEMISIMILISITVIAGYLVYRAYTEQMKQQQAGVSLVSRMARSRIAERITLVAGYINVSNNKVILIFNNFGDEDTNITKIIIPAIKVGGEIELMVFKVNEKIPRGQVKTIIISINRKDVGYPPGISVRINVWTLTGRVYSYNIRTVG